VLERGYSILRGGDGRVVTDAADVSVGHEIEAELRRGRLRLTAHGPAKISEAEETDR
jgi:exonuclease VII large subunit